MNYSLNNIENITSIDPMDWGKSGWIFLFSIALTYDINKREIYENFFISLKDVLPCYGCRVNYNKKLMNINRNVFNSKENLLKWLLNIRNSIAKDNGVKLMTLEDVLKEINYSNNENKYLLYYILIIIVIIVVIIKIYKN
jgi:hypothetical protein